MEDKLKEEESLTNVIEAWMPDSELSNLGRRYKQQIIALIKKPKVTEEELFEIKVQEYERGLADAHKEMPEVTDELIEEKAREMVDMDFHIPETDGRLKQELTRERMSFIRKLYEDMPARKVSVTKEFMEAQVKKIGCAPYHLEEMLTELGVEVVQ